MLNMWKFVLGDNLQKVHALGIDHEKAMQNNY